MKIKCLVFHYNAVVFRFVTLLRFGIMAGNDAHLMLSGIPANSIDYYNHSDYAELCIGGWKNNHSIIRVGTMEGTFGRISTPFILNNSTFK